MATHTVHTSPISTGFRTAHEGLFIHGDLDLSPPALMINPAASLQSLAYAAHSRAVRLQESLSHWSLTGEEGEISVNGVAASLEPLAEEVSLLLQELSDKARQLESANPAEVAS